MNYLHLCIVLRLVKCIIFCIILCIIIIISTHTAAHLLPHVGALGLIQGQGELGADRQLLQLLVHLTLFRMRHHFDRGEINYY